MSKLTKFALVLHAWARAKMPDRYNELVGDIDLEGMRLASPFLAATQSLALERAHEDIGSSLSV